MKKLIAITLFLCYYSTALHAQNYLQHKINSDRLSEIVAGINPWRANSLSTWKNDIMKLPDTVKTKLVQDAEAVNNRNWPSLNATGYLEFKENGNRSNYESMVNARRGKFNKLLIGESIENKGRFIPEIINGLWLILEESTWVSPAHLYSQKKGIGLPNIYDPYIDLGAARIAVDVAFAYTLFNKQFDKVSAQINDRILYELEKRILSPYLEREDYWWMSFQNNFINNWNIWINTNVLKTFLLIEQDTQRLTAGISKIMKSADKFIDSYPEDGACDEGPSYWMHSAGELGIMLTWLKDVSQDRASFQDIKKIANMGNYILSMHISNDRYVNFADANAIEQPSPLKVWNFGQLYDDSNMKGFASYLYANKKNKWGHHTIADFIEEIAHYQAISKNDTSFQTSNLSYYKSMGLITSRGGKDHTLFFAAIGSHNDVSHNHNDVGSFMLYSVGAPFLIDIGVGTYTAKTFSAQRYDIWTMQSQWHNLPIINGVQQKEGAAYAACDVAMQEAKDGLHYTVDIAKAYPTAAAVNSWKREFFLPAGKDEIEVTERYTLTAQKEESKLVFMLASKPTVKNKAVHIPLPNGKLGKIDFAKDKVSIDVEEVMIDDPRIAKVWGDTIYRVKVSILNNSRSAALKYKITVL